MDHSDPTNPQNYTIPFYVWCNKGLQISDNNHNLYAYNTNYKTEPKNNDNPNYSLNNNEPIRVTDVGNLCLLLLNLEPIKNSWSSTGIIRINI